MDKPQFSISKKYLLVAGVGLLAVVFTFTIINTHFQNKNLKEQYLREAKNLLTLVEVSTAEDLDALRINRIRENIQFLKQNKLVKEILIFNNDFEVITDGQIISENKFKFLNDPLIIKSFTTKSIQYRMGEKEMVLYIPIDLAYRRLGGIKLVYSLTELRKTELAVLFNNLKYAAIVYLIGLISILVFIRKTVKPIKKLINSTESVTEGNYEEQIVIKTRDELEILAESFNEMVRSLKVSRDEIIAAKEKAEKSDQLKTEFLAQMSHEIRTPLNAIVNFTQLLRVEFEHKLYGEIKDAFDIIELSSDRLIRTIDLILNMAQLQSGNININFEKVDLYEEILKPIINEFKLQANKKSLKLTSEKKTEDCLVSVDRYTVAQLFANLVDNAIKYSEEGEVKVSVEEVDSHLVVNVSDTGIGIAEDFLPFLFEPFMQEDRGYTRKFEGTGLGLSLVKKYSEINNAEMKVASQKSVGTTFSIFFKKLDKSV